MPLRNSPEDDQDGIALPDPERHHGPPPVAGQISRRMPSHELTGIVERLEREIAASLRGPPFAVARPLPLVGAQVRLRRPIGESGRGVGAPPGGCAQANAISLGAGFDG